MFCHSVLLINIFSNWNKFSFHNSWSSRFSFLYAKSTVADGGREDKTEHCMQQMQAMQNQKCRTYKSLRLLLQSSQKYVLLTSQLLVLCTLLLFMFVIDYNDSWAICHQSSFNIFCFKFTHYFFQKTLISYFTYFNFVFNCLTPMHASVVFSLLNHTKTVINPCKKWRH